jgi:hypothetical protein
VGRLNQRCWKRAWRTSELGVARRTDSLRMETGPYCTGSAEAGARWWLPTNRKAHLRIRFLTRVSQVRALIVEDDLLRRRELCRRFQGARVWVAGRYSEATRALLAREYDVVLLDFDLHERYRNGQDIAYWMRRLPRSRRPFVFVHSTNLRGAHGIFVTLRSAGFQVAACPYPVDAGRLLRSWVAVGSAGTGSARRWQG